MVVRRWLVVLVLAISSILVARPTAAGGPYQFYPITPCRLVDTRGPTGPWGAPSLLSWNTRSFQVNQMCGVPMTAQAAALNAAVLSPAASGFLTVWQYPLAWPQTSNINVTAGVSIANGCLVGLAAGSTNISVIYGSGSPNVDHADLIIDVTGYYQ